MIAMQFTIFTFCINIKIVIKLIVVPNQTKSGKFRSRRSDTQVGTIEKQYKINLGVRSDMKLGNFLKKKGYSSLSKLLKDVK